MPSTIFGRFKALSNADVRRGTCAAWRCLERATTKVGDYPVCPFHSDLFARTGSVDNPCVAPECRNVATKVPASFGVMLCNSHEHQRWMLGYTGEWQGELEPALQPLDAVKVKAFTERGREPLERFMDHVQGDHVTGCWNWTGGTHGQSGGHNYGRFTVGGKDWKTHIWAWVYLAGYELIEGFVLDHICENDLCVRPCHIQQIPNDENLKMGETRRTRTLPEGHEVVPPQRPQSEAEFLIGMSHELPIRIGWDSTVINEPY